MPPSPQKTTLSIYEAQISIHKLKSPYTVCRFKEILFLPRFCGTWEELPSDVALANYKTSVLNMF